MAHKNHDRETKSYHVFPSFTLAISHVCQHWRNVALSTPSIWTTIVVTPKERPPYEPVSKLLERSKSLPIDITISYDDLDKYEDDFELLSDADLEILFAMLIPHIHRWRTIKVTVSEYHHMYAFLSAVSDPSVPAAPQLTTLELYHYEDILGLDAFQHPRMANHLTLFAGSAPLLTRIVLWGVHVDWDQPWIASASNLTDLQLGCHAEDVRPSWAQFSTILRSASVENTLARFIGLFRMFHLPALKHLYLDSEVYIGDDYVDFFRELTRPAYPAQEQPRSLASRLESLKVPAHPCQVECIETLYGELQNLRSLNLSLHYYDPFFFDIISTPCTLPGRGDIWLPRLATVYVYGTSWIALRKLVLQSKEAGVPLTSLHVDRECGLDAENVDWLKENVKTFKFIEDR
ncbi:hypothetical protein EV363DRAFT_1325929 [Boletus edulis]|nr:hypothetical protein EV363DRAFT_1325929 [Boletus edulis]